MTAPDAPFRVLAAEDNEINQVVLAGLLGHVRPHYAITFVENGAKAVEAWREGDYALILMDVRMPIMDGREATTAIRAAEIASARARTPIVALTAEALEGEIDACYAAGMDAHVGKPFEIDALCAAIDKAMGAA
jgi:CheY-like chemotaxis protein